MDLKRGYQERLPGMAGIYKSRYLPNGRSKAFYRRNQATGEEKLESDPKTAKQMEEQFLYAQKKVQIEQMVDKESTIITKDNIFYKMMNNGMKLLLLDRDNVPENILPMYDSRLREFRTGGIGADEEGSWNRNLKAMFGHDSFYPFQRDILEKTFAGESSLVDFYTGAGKSLIFQFFSMTTPGMTVVLVPLISLMIDQIKKIPDQIPAICYNSWIPFIQRAKVRRLIKEGKVKILFVTPELFVSDIAWRLALHRTRVNLICIDEAHCLSEHSHSFRHSYSFVKDYIPMLNNQGSIQRCDSLFCSPETLQAESGVVFEEEKFPVLALTATSSKLSRRDIVDHFEIMPANVKYSNYYLRTNLIITVSHETSRQKNLNKLLGLRSMRAFKPMIVYCNFVKVTEAVSNNLKQNGVQSACFNS